MIVRELITKLGYRTDEASLNRAQMRMKQFAQFAKIAMFAVATAVIGIGIAAVKAAADMEMLETQFEVMLGSAEKAEQMMEKLAEFAATTPFAMNDLARGTQNLLSFGVAEDEVLGIMRMLGDTAGGSAEKLQSLVLAFGKVQTKGKASMEELNMMAERGLPIYSVLAEQLDVSRGEMLKMVSAGTITSETITEAFRSMTSEGGMFFEGMKKQSLTLTGLISTMKDNFTLLLVELGNELLPVIKTTVEMITELARGALGALIVQLSAILIPLLGVISSILTPLFEALVPAIAALMEVVTPLFDIIQKILEPVLKLLIPVLEFLGGLFSWIGELLDALIPIIDVVVFLFDLLIPIIEVAVKAVIMWMKGLMVIIKPILKLLGFLLKIILMPLMVIIKMLGVVMGMVMGVIEDLVAALRPVYVVFLRIFKILESAMDDIFEAFVEILESLVEIFLILMPLMMEFLPVLVFIMKAVSWMALGLTVVALALKWVTGKVVELFDWISATLNALLGWLGIVTGARPDLTKQLEEKEFHITVDQPTASEILASGAGTVTGGAKVNMENNINVTGSNIENPAAAAETMREAARAIFSVELQRLLVNAEL